MNLERNSIGYEINEDLIPVIKRRLDIGQTLLIEREAQIEISFAQYRIRESME